MLYAPYSDELMSMQLGTVSNIMSSNCHAHHLFILRLVGLDWHNEVDDCRIVTILRKHRHSGLEALVKDSIYPRIELVKDPDVPDHPGQGRILDPNMINPQLFKSWSDRCYSLHGTNCQREMRHHAHALVGPAFLVDTHRNCIVPASLGMRYVALSYVWGRQRWLTTRIHNVQRLSIFAALLNEPDLPNTIIDAMRATRLLGERYLWVDSLCIVQDEEAKKSAQIEQMWAIYAGACVTIVAAQGQDAGHGLPRLPGSTWSGKLVQQFFNIGDDEPVIERVFSLEQNNNQQAPWYNRAWTFQELLFSKRLIIFEKNSVRWECPGSTWFEDVECQEVRGVVTRRRWQGAMPTLIPDLSAYGDLVSQFNQRELTYPEDALFAIAGITTVLSGVFKGGFICGLPELFFDVSLLWQPRTTVHRRRPQIPPGSSDKVVYLPSWSWGGWEGGLDPWTWNSGKDYSKNHGQGCTTSRETFRILEWRSNDKPSYEGSVAVRSDFDTFRSAHNTIRRLPPGWTRHVYAETEDESRSYLGPLCERLYFYTQDSDPSLEVWYPIPLCEPGSPPVVRAPMRYLLTTTHASVFLPRKLRIDNAQNCISLYSNNGQWVGILRLHNAHDGAALERDGVCELVAISRGRASNSREKEPGLDEWEFEERQSTSSFYEFYNVMWVAWDGDVAHRRAVGRVLRHAWETANLKEVSLILA